MSETTNGRDGPAWVDIYLGHRSAYRDTHPQRPDDAPALDVGFPAVGGRKCRILV